MSKPRYSFVVYENVATAYTTPVAAIAAYEALTVAAAGDDEAAYLYLAPDPSKINHIPTWGGTWTDAYGVVRVVGTGEEYTPPEEE